MKIRNGFVSNSSSSSFVIDAKGETSTVRDVATIMINTIIEELEEDNDWRPGEQERWIDTRKKWLKVLNELPEDEPVQFLSTNYDTWIRKVADNILVSTCNNTIWDLPNRTSLSDNAEKELRKELGDTAYEDFTSYSYDFFIQSYFDDFYSLHFEVKGTEASGFEDWNDSYCKRCNGYTQLWKTSKGNICPSCDIHLFQRKEKLEKIEKNIQE